MSVEYEVQGLPISSLAEQFGTPLYVYDSDVLARQYGDLRAALPEELKFFFSLKANPNIAVCARLHALGAGAEVSSLAELTTALRAGVPPADIIFLGPGKSVQELAACLDHGVRAIVCESLDELRLIDDLARERAVTAPVLLRVNPSFQAKGSGLTMGGKPRQFGIDDAQLFARPGLAGEHPSVRLLGVHCYLGTRILTEDVVVENTRRILDLADRLARHLGFPLETVDVGGGLGVAYFDNERDLDVAVLAAGLGPVLAAFRAEHPGTRLIMELGRYLTAPAGIYVARVRYVKTSMEARFAVTDGGTHHHMAAVGIGSFVKRNFPMRLLTAAADPADVGPWQITGPLCTPNDTLGKNIVLPALRAGDLIGVLRSGAYGPTASPVQFLSHGYPAEVLVHDGVPYLVRRRDTPDDLLRSQLLPDVLTTQPAGVR
jgi:diaminopimelate decarboxylase